MSWRSMNLPSESLPVPRTSFSSASVSDYRTRLALRSSSGPASLRWLLSSLHSASAGLRSTPLETASPGLLWRSFFWHVGQSSRYKGLILQKWENILNCKKKKVDDWSLPFLLPCRQEAVGSLRVSPGGLRLLQPGQQDGLQGDHVVVGQSQRLEPKHNKSWLS